MYSSQLERIRQKLQLLKETDLTYKTSGSGNHRYHLHPVLNGDEISEFEARYQIKLPTGYIAFITSIGNGGAGPFYGLEKLQDVIYEDLDYRDNTRLIDPSKPFPYTEAWNMDKYDHVNEESDMELEKEYFDPKHSNGLIRLCNYGCGSSLNLVVNGKEYGNIWTDDRCIFLRYSDIKFYPLYFKRYSPNQLQ